MEMKISINFQIVPIVIDIEWNDLTFGKCNITSTSSVITGLIVQSIYRYPLDKGYKFL